MTMSVPSTERSTRPQRRPVRPPQQEWEDSGMQKSPPAERVFQGARTRRAEAPSILREKAPHLDEIAKMKIVDVQAAIEAFEMNPEEKKRLGQVMEEASREKHVLQVQLINRLKEMGMGPEMLTSCLENPKSIGWKQRGLELIRRSIERMVDRPYQTVEQLVVAYKQVEETLKNAQKEFQAVYESHTPAAQKLREEKNEDQKREIYFFDSSLKDEFRRLDAQLTTIRLRTGREDFSVRDAELVQQRIVEIGMRAGVFAAKNPNIVRSLDWQLLQEKIASLERTLNTTRIHAQREVEALCVKARQIEIGQGNSDPEVARLRKEVVDRLWAQESMNESIQEHADRSFVQYVNQELVSVDPVLRSLLSAYQLTQDLREAEQLIRESAVYGQLDREMRALVNRYMSVMKKRSERIAFRYGYHMQHAWQKENLNLVRQGVLEMSAERQKKFDQVDVEIHARARDAYPHGKITKPEQILQDGLVYGQALHERTPVAEKLLLEVDGEIRQLSTNASVATYQGILTRARKALAMYALDGASREMQELAGDVKQGIGALVHWIEIAVARDRAKVIRSLEQSADRWIEGQDTVIEKFFGESGKSRVKNQLREVASSSLEEEMIRLKQGSTNDAWRETVDKALEKRLEAAWKQLFIKNFFDQHYHVRPGETPTRGKLRTAEMLQLSDIFDQKSTQEVIDYCTALSQYLALYDAYHGMVLKPSQKEVFTQAWQELRAANRRFQLSPIAFERAPFWDDPANYATFSEDADADLTPEAFKERFAKQFSDIDPRIPNIILEECAGIIGWERVQGMSKQDRNYLKRLILRVMHPDYIGRLTGRYEENIARLEEDISKTLERLSFGNGFDEQAKQRMATTIESGYPPRETV